MKKHAPKNTYDLVVRIAVPVLFVLLCVLTIVTIYTISWNNAGTDLSFDLDGLTNEARREEADVSNYLLPEFIGITTAGNRNGISSSYNLVSELYGILTPTIYYALSGAVPVSEDAWDEYAAAENSVYIRYHSELPDGIVSLFAGMSMGEEEPTVQFNANILEIFLLLYTDGTSETTLVTRSAEGEIWKYVLTDDCSPVTVSELERFVRSYSSRMVPFIFNEGKYESISATEPLFAEAITMRNILMRKAAFIQNSPDERDVLLRIFGFNPDKLLNVHEDDSGAASYYDTQGILYLRDSAFEYVRSYADSGMEVSDILGGVSSNTLAEYVRAAVLLFKSIREIDKNYAGGDADIVLDSASSENGKVTLRFMYTVDNIRIAEENAAFEITFSAGDVLRAEVYTIAVRILAEREASYAEWWFVSMMEEPSRNVRLVYRSDYSAEYVSAEWAAECLRTEVTKPDLNVPPDELAEPENPEPDVTIIAGEEGDHGE